MRPRPRLVAFVLVPLLGGCGGKDAGDPVPGPAPAAPTWRTDFFDDFDTFDEANWQDQILWVNNEH